MIRQNAVVLPLYQLILLFVFLVGFAAILQVPGLKGADVDLALFKLSVKTFDPWTVGIIGAAGVLTALVPGSMILMTAATLLANNLYRLAHRSAADQHVVRIAKLLVPVVALVAVYFTLAGGQTIVALLLMGYSVVTQLFPPLALSLTKKRWATPVGAAAGIVAGVATVAAVNLTHSTIATLVPALPVPIQELNVGLIALGVNVIVLAVVSAGERLVKGAVARIRKAHCALRGETRAASTRSLRLLDKLRFDRRTLQATSPGRKTCALPSAASPHSFCLPCRRKPRCLAVRSRSAC